MNRLKRLADLFNLIMYTFCFSMAGLFMLDAVTGMDLGPLVLFLGGFVLFAYAYFLRVKIRRLPVYAVLHLPFYIFSALFCALFYAFPGNDAAAFNRNFGSAILLIVLSVCLTLADIVFWMNAVGDEKNMPVSESGGAIEGFRPVYKEGFAYLPAAFVVVFVLGLAFGAYADRPYFEKTAYMLGVIYIGLYFLRSYVRQLFVLKENMHRETGAHQKRILTANARLALPVIGLAFVMMFVLQSDRLIAFSKQILFWVAKWSVRIVVTVIGWILDLFGSSTESVPIQSAQIYAPAADTPLWLQTLAKFAEHLLTALFYGVLLFLLIRAVIFFIRKFRERSVNLIMQETYSDMTEVRERITKSERKERTRRALFAGTNSEKIRRRYRRFVHKQIRNGLSVGSNQTPLELVDPLREIAGMDAATLVDITKLYDRARYGGGDLQKEDVLAMEKLL